MVNGNNFVMAFDANGNVTNQTQLGLIINDQVHYNNMVNNACNNYNIIANTGIVMAASQYNMGGVFMLVYAVKS